MRLFILLIFICRLGFAVDFDCVVVGTSPFCLFEALYRAHTGNRVLILEGAAECGGAWKAVTACGIPHADLGCHQIGHDAQLRSFLEEYAGCHLVSLDNPLIPYNEPSKSPNGFYFSRGCFELIDNLERLIEKTNITLLLNEKLESIYVDTSAQIAYLKTKDMQFTASKIIMTQMSSFFIENFNTQPQQSHGRSKYFHLYVLIQDPTPPKFCYQGGVSAGISRLMNLTHFVGLTNSGQQLLVIQTNSEQSLNNGETYFNDLKTRNLVDRSAFILRTESHIYEQAPSYQNMIHQLGHSAQGMFETLNTGHFQALSTYIPKWKQALKPFREVFP